MSLSPPADRPRIVPRWEWRGFGDRFGLADERLADLTPADVQDSDEVYLLSDTHADSCVKVRDDLMDIKVLIETNEAGLEHWTPILKAPPPLLPPTIEQVFEALHLQTPALARGEYTLEQFARELADTSDSICSASVHKHRVRYRVGGCMVEVVDITVNGRPARTLAIETEDAAAVIGLVRELALEDFVNTSYPRALVAILNGGYPRYAVIDVGTNSVKFHVGQRADDGTWSRVVDRAEVTRLGEGLGESGEISQAALDRTVTAIAAMVDEARDAGALRIAAVGTAGLRAARNAEYVIGSIHERTGVTVETISGEEESRLAYLAAKSGVGSKEGELVVFDTGGGSTQFTFGHGDEVRERFSVEVGAVRYTERFGLAKDVSADVLQDVFATIDADLARLDGRLRPDALVGMGGTLTNMAAVKDSLSTYDPDVVQGTVLDHAEIDRQIELYRSRDAAGRREIVGLQPKRADVILAGACVVRAIMRKLDQDSITVSDRGLRHGLLVERFGYAQAAENRTRPRSEGV